MQKILFFAFVIFTTNLFAGISQPQNSQDKNSSSFSFFGGLFENQNSKLKTFLAENKIREALNFYRERYELSQLPTNSSGYKEWKDFDRELILELVEKGNAYLESTEQFDQLLEESKKVQSLKIDSSQWDKTKEIFSRLDMKLNDYDSYQVFKSQNAEAKKLQELRKIKEILLNKYVLDINKNLYSYFKENKEFKSKYPINLNALKLDELSKETLSNFCNIDSSQLKLFIADFSNSFGSNEKDKLQSCSSSKSLAKSDRSFFELLDEISSLYKDGSLQEVPEDLISFYKLRSKDKNEFDYEIDMNVPAVIKTASLDEIKKSASKYKVVFMPRIISVKTNVLKREERNSQYQSGVDRKPNPDYEINRIEAYRAQSELANIRFNGLTMTGWAKLANAFLEGAAQVSATQKLQSLSATPQYIEIPIFQAYKFTASQITTQKKLELDVLIISNKKNDKTSYTFEDKRDFEMAFNFNPLDKSLGSHITDVDIKNYEKQNIRLNLSDILDSRATKLASLDKLESIEKPAIVDITNLKTETYKTKSLESKKTNLTSDIRFQSVVVVTQPDGSLGSGFYVAPYKIITNYHVIENSSFVEIKKFDGTLASGKIEKFDLTRDLALVKVDSPGLPVKFYSGNELILGETVFAIGHPKGLEFSLTKGITSAVRKMNTIPGKGGDKVLLIQTDTPINSGNSGGPLFMKNEVVGVNVQKLVETDIEGLNFAIHYKEVLDFIKK
jgi:serine protease Do